MRGGHTLQKVLIARSGEQYPVKSRLSFPNNVIHFLKNGYVGRTAANNTSPYYDRRRIRREYDLLSRLRHRGFVNVHELVSDENGNDGFTMEPLHFFHECGEVNKHPAAYNLGSWLHFSESLCSTLGELHNHNAVHNDVKPSNIGFRFNHERGTVDIRPVLIDFEYARTYGMYCSDTQDEKGTVACSPAFASPEQVTRKRIYPQSDVYMASMTCLSVLTNKRGRIAPLYSGPHHLMKASAIGEPYPHWDLAAKLIGNHDIVELFKHALERKPDDRFRNGTEFATAIRQEIDSLDYATLCKPFQ